MVEALREDGQRLPARRHTRLKAIDATWPQRPRVARGGQGQGAGPPLRLRLRIRWPPRTQSFGSCLTHWPPQRDPLEVLCRAYQGRGHVE